MYVCVCVCVCVCVYMYIYSSLLFIIYVCYFCKKDLYTYTHKMPTFEKFRDLIRNCTSQNVVLVCFSGHAVEGGELVLSRTETTWRCSSPNFSHLILHIARASKGSSTRPEGGFIECVLLNGRYTCPFGVVLHVG
jgi:hypothetical protein